MGRLDGARPCLQCGHDLHGQAIVRESTHGLLIARCPECGTVAALVEHPTLGIWGRRLGIILMSTMLALLVPLVLLSALAIFGVAAGIHDEQVGQGRDVLNSLIEDDQVSPEWWAAHGGDTTRKVLAAMLTEGRNTRVILAILSPVPILLGILWAGILVSVPRRRLWVVALATGAVALFYLWIGSYDDEHLGVDPVWPWTAAFQITAWPFMGGVIVIESCLMAVGLLGGRSLLRWLAAFVLPPRARRTMSFLWTVDGLIPPRGRR